MNRYIEAIIVTTVIIFALFVCGWMIYDGTSKVNKNEEYIGYSLVIGGDTLSITGYNASYCHHILSNGLLVDDEYVWANAFKITPKNSQIDTNTLKVFREMGYQITKIDTTRYGVNP